ncbi:MAG: hypothetical protein WAL70_12665 [Aeromicrobium sp.]
MSDATAAGPRVGTPIGWPLRAWFAAEVFFGIAALLSIGLDPGNTEKGWAWPIEPVVMAAVFGAFYFAVAPIMILALFAKRWEMVRVIVPTAVLFTSAELLATLVHWDKFSTGTAPFYLWFASYLLPPPIFIATYLWQQRRAAPRSPNDQPLPAVLRTLLFVLGGFLSVEAVVAFAHPAWFIGDFPWSLTPLTARALCGFLLAVGALMVTMAVENDRDRVRLASPLLILVLPAVALQVARFSEQVDLSHFRVYLGVVLFGLVAGCGVALARGSWRDAMS